MMAKNVKQFGQYVTVELEAFQEETLCFEETHNLGRLVSLLGFDDERFQLELESLLPQSYKSFNGEVLQPVILCFLLRTHVSRWKFQLAQVLELAEQCSR